MSCGDCRSFATLFHVLAADAKAVTPYGAQATAMVATVTDILRSEAEASVLLSAAITLGQLALLTDTVQAAAAAQVDALGNTQLATHAASVPDLKQAVADLRDLLGNDEHK